jgi:uncharacterized protein YutE (UPF0331/DUF86 family)
MLNSESITARVRHLQERIKFLKRYGALDESTYLADRTTQVAAERDFQVAIECCLDIAKHIIVGRELQLPGELRQVFSVLAQANLLPTDLAEAMAEMTKLRNRLVHWYMTIEPDKIYTYLQSDVPVLERFAAFATGILTPG